MPRAYHRSSSHCPDGFIAPADLGRELNQRTERVRRIARRHGLLVEVMGDFFIDRAAFLELLKPRPVAPTSAASSNHAA
jgi:hypothetical protein